MMRVYALAAALLVGFGAVFLASSPALAQEPMLSVRLVEADNSDGPNSGSIEDILPMLRRTLRFSSYRLLRTGRIAQRDGARTELPQGLTVTLSGGEAQSMTVNVSQHERRLVQTRVVLAPDRPVILGGIPGEQGATLIVVLTARSAEARPNLPDLGPVEPRGGTPTPGPKDRSGPPGGGRPGRP